MALYKKPQTSGSIQYLNCLNWEKLKEQWKSLCCKSGKTINDHPSLLRPRLLNLWQSEGISPWWTSYYHIWHPSTSADQILENNREKAGLQKELGMRLAILCAHFSGPHRTVFTEALGKKLIHQGFIQDWYEVYVALLSPVMWKDLYELWESLVDLNYLYAHTNWIHKVLKHTRGAERKRKQAVGPCLCYSEINMARFVLS